jgi:hypothetical protein
MPVEVVVILAKFFHGLTRSLNYLQNEEGVVELDDAREKATEVLKRLLHTQKVRRNVWHIIPYLLYNYSIQYALFCYI